MTSSSSADDQQQLPRDAAHWATRVSALQVTYVPDGAVNLNVDGHRVAGPLQGFGPLWQKTYRARLSGAQVTPVQVIEFWKTHFAELQPPQNHLYAGLAGLEPGEIVLLNAWMRGIPVDSGLMVLYADAESFTLMTPEGCPEAGWLTFSAFTDGEETVAQVQSFGRANDPIYEFGFRFLGGAVEQEKIWTHVLTGLAARLGVHGEVQIQRVCLDPRVRWSGIKNVWSNASVRSILYTAAHPLRLLRR